MTDYKEIAKSLEGDTVVSIGPTDKYDITLEFESGRILYVGDAKWWVEEPDS